MKNKIFFSLLICSAFTMQAHVLSNPILKAADNAGMFDKPIFDILRVRQEVKSFMLGQKFWRGVETYLTVVDEQGKTLSSKLRVIIKRPEAIFGGTFIILSPEHPQLFNFVTESEKANVEKYIHSIQQHSMLHRYEHIHYHAVKTGSFAIHPITKQKLPVFVADYILEGYDARITHAHFAIPAHDDKDFAFAHKHNLEIKLVVSYPEDDKTSSPQFNKNTKQLSCAYTGEYDDCIIINSSFANGSMKEATEKVITHMQTNNLGTEYKEHLLYSLHGKFYSLHDLRSIEATLQQERKELSAHQKEQLAIVMMQAQSDFLSIVEQFLVNARDAKELMIELIEESCRLRKNSDCYLLKWSHLNTSEPERIVFKRDIKTFQTFYVFCGDLVDFLSDFASSCTHALANLKNLKK